MLPILKLDTNYGSHELFFKYIQSCPTNHLVNKISFLRTFNFRDAIPILHSCHLPNKIFMHHHSNKYINLFIS